MGPDSLRLRGARRHSAALRCLTLPEDCGYRIELFEGAVVMSPASLTGVPVTPAALLDRIFDDQRGYPGRHHLNRIVDVLHNAINVTSTPSVTAELVTEPHVLPSPVRHFDAVSR